MYSVDKDISIHYKGDDLSVNLLFDNRNACGQFLSSLHEALKYYQFATEMDYIEQYQELTVAELPPLVLLMHYKTQDIDSDEVSVAVTVRNHISQFSGTTEEAVLLMAENPNLVDFVGLQPYRCHLINQSDYDHEKNNPNNILLMSWSLHQRFYGLKTIGTHLTPQIAISFVEKSNKIEYIGEFEIERVTISIESPDQKILDAVNTQMKAGSSYDRTLHRILMFVYVEDAEDFERCLTYKYTETQLVWKKKSIGAKVTEVEAHNLRRSVRLELAKLAIASPSP